MKNLYSIYIQHRKKCIKTGGEFALEGQSYEKTPEKEDFFHEQKRNIQKR